MTTEEQIRVVAERVASGYGLEIVDVELRGSGAARMLRITIDRDGPAGAGQDNSTPSVGGVTHEDCSHVSREVGTILDVEDVVPGASYTLEVSSPGLDRKLQSARDFERFAGSRVKVLVYQAVQGQKHFDGRLESFREGRLTLDLSAPAAAKARKKSKPGHPVAAPPPKLVEIELGNVERANLVPEV